MRRRLPETAADDLVPLRTDCVEQACLAGRLDGGAEIDEVDRLLVNLDLIHPAQLIDEPAQAEFFNVDIGHEVSIHRAGIVQCRLLLDIPAGL